MVIPHLQGWHHHPHMHFLSCIASENVCGMRRTLLCEATMWHFRYILKLVFPHSSNDSTCKCTRKKKQKTHNGPEKHGGSRTLVLQGLRPLQPKPNMADTHSHHWDHKNTFNFAPTRSRNSLALGIPQPIRFIWDPQNCTTYVYTDFALSPTNHHNQKQNMPLPSKMNKIHIKSLNSQHIEWKWYKSH